MCEKVRKDLAHGLVRDLRAVDASLADIEAGRTERSIVDADFAVIANAAPPGTRSRSTAWSWLETRTRCAARLARFLEHREHRRVILTGHDRGVAVQCRNARGRGCVDHIGLAATPSRQLTHPGRRGARNIPHHLIASNEPLRKMTTQPAGALNRPPSARELLRPSRQLAISGHRGVDPQRRDRCVRCRIDRRGGVEFLCGSTPMIMCMLRSVLLWESHGRHADF